MTPRSYKPHHPERMLRLGRPFLRFFQIEASGGIVLLMCAVIALILANSPFAETYIGFWNTPIGISFGKTQLTHSLVHWINDGLMTIFFFVVGLEIKRELVHGELKNPKVAALPAIAALGGMIVPALIYSFILQGNAGSQGWGIPMATDIAFVVGFLALFGKRVSNGLKIFLLSLAIVDDIGAVIVIALFYSSGISIAALSAGMAGFGLTAALNRLGVRQIPVYVFLGVLIWLAFLLSGVHPTVAGVLLGLLTPASAWVGDASFQDALSAAQRKWHELTGSKRKYGEVNGLITAAKETVSPLERLEIALHPWVAFFIVPLFALANAGVPIDGSAITSQISIGVALGLFLGKPAGILIFSWLALKLIRSRLPAGATWQSMVGASILGGIGFTMSIFIAGLALDGHMLVEGKAGTFVGSTISAIVGFLVLHFTLPKLPAPKSR
jgi:NhaA family Na+:H+ antiporter